MSQQMRQPPTVSFICLVSSSILDLLRVCQIHLETVFHYIEYRLPIRTRTLHDDMGNSLGLQPLTHCLQFGGDGAERPKLYARFPG
jgi:hypothetical protein